MKPSILTNNEIIQRMKKAKKNYKNLPLIGAILSTEETVKKALCRIVVRFQNRDEIDQSGLAKILNIPTKTATLVSNYQYNRIKIDELVNYVEALAKHDKMVARELKQFRKAIKSLINLE